MRLKAKTFGARGFTCQLPRIDHALKQAGVILESEKPDFVYANDPGGYEEAGKYDCKKIFNVLDVPYHIKSFSGDDLRERLKPADIVTCISKTVQKDLAELVGVNAEVIYNPVKNVLYVDEWRPYYFKYVFIGRNADPNKRNHIAIDALRSMGVSPDDVHVFGSEQLGFGKYYGVVPDEELNIAYNCADYVFCLGKVEGICLPLIESAICGAIPIYFNDNPTAREWLGNIVDVYPSSGSLVNFIKELDKNVELKKAIRADIFEKGKIFAKQFAPESVAKNILDIYHKIAKV